MREYQSIDSVVRGMITGAIPEREKELEDIWELYSPSIQVARDRRGLFCIEGGAFDIIQFTTRSMEVLWIIGFASWKAFHSYSMFLAKGFYDPSIIRSFHGQRQAEAEYRDAIERAQELLALENIDDFTWPQDMPHPRNGRPEGSEEEKAVYDLICMAGAFIFLHEIKHVMLSQNNACLERLDEERECDVYAVNMMFQIIDRYSR